jgi:hypothetical protein
MAMTKSGKRAALGVAPLLALLLALSACGGGSDKPAAHATTSPSPTGNASLGPSGSPGPSSDNSASASPSLPPDPVLKTYVRVLRGGKRPRPTVSAAAAKFNGAIRFGDGVTLVVTGVDQAKVTDQGPGEFPGEPKTRISLRLTNGSDATLRLNQVVVTAIYGSSRREARPVYDDRSRDFSGVLKPGSKSTAAYSFSIPKAQLGRVTMLVDFDGRHTVATFQGDPLSAR